MGGGETTETPVHFTEHTGEEFGIRSNGDLPGP
jgi:hypothetical protein